MSELSVSENSESDCPEGPVSIIVHWGDPIDGGPGVGGDRVARLVCDLGQEAGQEASLVLVATSDPGYPRLVLYGREGDRWCSVEMEDPCPLVVRIARDIKLDASGEPHVCAPADQSALVAAAALMNDLLGSHHKYWRRSGMNSVGITESEFRTLCRARRCVLDVCSVPALRRGERATAVVAGAH